MTQALAFWRRRLKINNGTQHNWLVLTVKDSSTSQADELLLLSTYLELPKSS